MGVNHLKSESSGDQLPAETKSAEKGKKTKGLKTPPDINIYKRWCKGCGLCASFCPTGALARDEEGYPFVKDINKCINCGLCEIRCPDFAITVRERSKTERKRHEKDQKNGKDGTASPGE